MEAWLGLELGILIMGALNHTEFFHRLLLAFNLGS